MKKKKNRRRKQKSEAYNPHLRELVLQIVDNQIAGHDESGNPLSTTVCEDPEYVKNTFARLSVIYEPLRAKEMIAAVLLDEIYDVLKYTQPFNEMRYKTRLEGLK